jgi:hypothetical protein
MTMSVEERLEIEFEKRREHYYEDLSWNDLEAELDLQDGDDE